MSSEAEAVQAPGADAAPIVKVEQPRAKAEPVGGFERVASVDVLRGVAVLGILAMNIVYFAWPAAAYSNPTRGGGFDGLDRGVWVFDHIVFSGKMMTIFSMLFGAGLVLMGERADARGRSLVWVYYRRVFWLLVIGAAHAIFLWSGDILFAYAECGLVLYPLRRRSARTLIILGILALSVYSLQVLAIRTGVRFLKVTAVRADAVWAGGGRPTKFQAWINELWTETVQPSVMPSAQKQREQFDKDLDIHRGGYLDIVKHRAKEFWGGLALGFIRYGIWMMGGRMLLGMGLMKLGVFSARRSRRFYVWMVALGYGLGLPLVGYDTYVVLQHDFHYFQARLSNAGAYALGSVVIALGHVGVVMLICKAGVLSWLTQPLAAVGRMALSNYLAQSLICTTLFYGYGFGLYGTVHRAGLAGIVLAIWLVQLVVCSLWLAYFRFGPAEWLWRSLTYWRLQPMRRQPDASPVAASL
jgi:uncharacterized protein